MRCVGGLDRSVGHPVLGVLAINTDGESVEPRLGDGLVPVSLVRSPSENRNRIPWPNSRVAAHQGSS